MEAERGSERMMKERLGERTFAEEDVRDLLGASRQDGVELRDIWIYGQPGIDVLRGSFQVTPEKAGSLVQELFSKKIRVRLEAFPFGIPFPEIIQIDFESRGYNRH